MIKPSITKLSKSDIFKASRLLDNGFPHKFSESIDYDVIVNRKHYAPKAIVGVAAQVAYGVQYEPRDFPGGLGTSCFNILVKHSFKIVSKQVRKKTRKITLIKTSDTKPTHDHKELDNRVARIRRSLEITSLPEGQRFPLKVEVNSSTYYREPLVKAWLLENAEGKCESCDAIAPFILSNGYPYLEIHHVRPMADGGSDTIQNAVAICPNCHRAFHLSGDNKQRKAKLYQSISRLVVE